MKALARFSHTEKLPLLREVALPPDDTIAAQAVAA
jgi:hypothetical protein